MHIFYMKKVTHRVKTTMKMILVAVTMIFWVSMMNKLYYGCLFWYVTILFSSNKLLNLKYIHHYFFLKFLTKKSQCILWAGVSYGPGNTVYHIPIFPITTYISGLIIALFTSMLLKTEKKIEKLEK